MMITLNVSSIRSMLQGRGRSKPDLALLDVPAYTRQTLGFHGLSISTDLLPGATRQTLEALRDRGDKAGCACLVLIEPDGLALADTNASKAAAGIDRAERVLEAAHLLGCNSATVGVQGRNDEPSFDRAVQRLRRVVERAERLEVNLLVSPQKGLTEQADRLTELIKKVGGFRIGTFPDFQAAVESGDPVTYLRRLTPYASALSASTIEFEDPAPLEEDSPKDDEALDIEDLLNIAAPVHTAYDLTPLIGAVAAVGYDGTLSIDYRGSGDGTLGVMRSREALEAAFEALADG